MMTQMQCDNDYLWMTRRGTSRPAVAVGMNNSLYLVLGVLSMTCILTKQPHYYRTSRVSIRRYYQ